MPVRRLVGFPPWRTGPTGPASSVGPDRARTPRHFGAGLRLRGFQSSDLLRQPPGSVPGVVVVRGDRGGRAHEQSCGKDPALGRAVAQERLRLPQRSRMPVRGAHVDRGPNPAVAETSGAGLPVSRDRGSSGWPSRSAITGPSWGLNGYLFHFIWVKILILLQEVTGCAERSQRLRRLVQHAERLGEALMVVHQVHQQVPLNRGARLLGLVARLACLVDRLEVGGRGFPESAQGPDKRSGVVFFREKDSRPLRFWPWGNTTRTARAAEHATTGASSSGEPTKRKRNEFAGRRGLRHGSKRP